MSKKQRPVFLSLTKIKVPITAYVSFAHRVTGVLLYAMVALFMYLLSLSLSSKEGFNEAKYVISQPLTKLLLWICLSTLAYHTIVGVRHIAMDFGCGENLKAGKVTASISITLSLVSSILIALWLYR